MVKMQIQTNLVLGETIVKIGVHSDRVNHGCQLRDSPSHDESAYAQMLLERCSEN